MVRTLLMLLSASAVGYVFVRLHVPGGTIVGAMVGAAGCSLILGGTSITLPRPLVSGAYVVIGTIIGAGITRDALRDLRAVAAPAVLSAVAIIAAGLTIALLLRALGIAPDAVVLATSPGALSAMTALAAEQDGGLVVPMFHTVRVVLVLLSMPLLLRLSSG